MRFTNTHRRNIFTYYREQDKSTWYVEGNLAGHEVKRPGGRETMERKLGNYEKTDKKVVMPYEVNIYRM